MSANKLSVGKTTINCHFSANSNSLLVLPSTPSNPTFNDNILSTKLLSSLPTVDQSPPPIVDNLDDSLLKNRNRRLAQPRIIRVRASSTAASIKAPAAGVAGGVQGKQREFEYDYERKKLNKKQTKNKFCSVASFLLNANHRLLHCLKLEAPSFIFFLSIVLLLSLFFSYLFLLSIICM